MSSFLRLLSPAVRKSSSNNNAAAGSSSSSSSAVAAKPVVSLHIPAYGVINLSPLNHNPLINPNAIEGEPKQDYILTGELEVRMPPGTRKRCKRIEVKFANEIVVGFPEGGLSIFDRRQYPVQKDVVLERKVEFDGGAEGIWLEEGSQRFQFSLILPYNLPCHDFSPRMHSWYTVYALVEGMNERTLSGSATPVLSIPRQSFSSRSRSRTPRSQSQSQSRSRSRQASPSRYEMAKPVDPQSIDAALSNLNITSGGSGSRPGRAPKASSKSIVPTYDQSQTDTHGDDWLVGFYREKRPIIVIHNPNPEGKVNQFTDRMSQYTPGLGMCDIRVHVEQWSIASFFPCHLTLSSLSPAITVFSFRVRLQQTREYIAYQDRPKHTSIQNLTVLEVGKLPPPGHVHPGRDVPALWRGPIAGGSDVGEFDWEGSGRVPKEEAARPSTLAGVNAPITNSHKLIYEILFSVHGEDDKGEVMTRPGPGGLRIMRRAVNVIVPSCALIAKVIDLPPYNLSLDNSISTPMDTSRADLNGPCPVCHKRPLERLCTTCPPTTIPHLRHDLGLGGKETDGVCPACAGKSLLPPGDARLHECACEYELDSFAIQGRGLGLEEGGNVGEEELREIKEDGERGRIRGRQ